jgi:hypothetical protein
MADKPSISQGADAETAATLLRKYLSPALKGPGWDALIEAPSGK